MHQELVGEARERRLPPKPLYCRQQTRYDCAFCFVLLELIPFALHSAVVEYNFQESSYRTGLFLGKASPLPSQHHNALQVVWHYPDTIPRVQALGQ